MTDHTARSTASFERELKKVLQYATTWKAIVLLDEADVFLEARENGKNSDRNSLVAGKVASLRGISEYRMFGGYG